MEFAIYACLVLAVYGFKKGERRIFFEQHRETKYTKLDEGRCQLWSLVAAWSPLLIGFVGPLVVLAIVLLPQHDASFTIFMPSELCEDPTSRHPPAP